MVTNDLAAFWGVDVDDLHILAKENTARLLPESITPMNVLMDRLFGEQLGDEEVEFQDESYPAEDESCQAEDIYGMYVATNNEKRFGAGTLLYDGLIRDFAAKVGRDFYILPSSVHELILLMPNKNLSIRDIQQMVHDVNADVVSDEDYLSDSVYIYRAASGKVEIAGGEV